MWMSSRYRHKITCTIDRLAEWNGGENAMQEIDEKTFDNNKNENKKGEKSRI